MALLALAHATYPGQVEAATVNHGFRTEAAEEAAMVAQWCGGKGIPHATLHPPEPIVGSLQSAARQMRYRLIWPWCGERGLASLLPAHHPDEQPAPMLIRLNKCSL